jgi:transcriptional regulator with XRE-family HTH domain
VPRPSPARTAPDEENLARRIEHERTAKGWSYESLAKRMEDAGCKIHPSAIYKIERGEPRRRVTVNEFRAFASVFGIPMDQLLVPEEVWSTGLALELFTQLTAAMEDLKAAWDRRDEIMQALGDALVQTPAARAAVVDQIHDRYGGQQAASLVEQLSWDWREMLERRTDRDVISASHHPARVAGRVRERGHQEKQ